MIQLSLVIPCYNESGNLPKLFERVAALRKALPAAEVILVDNGSTDKSPEAFARLQAETRDALVKTVRVEKNQGYGFGILSGLKAAQGEYLAWTHADLQTDLVDAARALEKALSAPDPKRVLVKGNRRKRNAFDSFFTWGMSAISSFALGTVVSDVNAQPKLFHRAFYDTFSDAPWDFSLDLYVLYRARRAGMEVAAIPVYFADRQHGESKGGGTLKGKIKLIKRTFAYIFKLKAQLRGQPA